VSSLSEERIATLDVGLEAPDELDLEVAARMMATALCAERGYTRDGVPQISTQFLVRAILATAPEEQRKAIWRALRNR
jgi:hypothetical protein